MFRLFRYMSRNARTLWIAALLLVTGMLVGFFTPESWLRSVVMGFTIFVGGVLLLLTALTLVVQEFRRPDRSAEGE